MHVKLTYQLTNQPKEQV